MNHLTLTNLLLRKRKIPRALTQGMIHEVRKLRMTKDNLKKKAGCPQLRSLIIDHFVMKPSLWNCRGIPKRDHVNFNFYMIHQVNPGQDLEVLQGTSE